MSDQESRARVYWDLMQKFKDQKTVTPKDAPAIASTVRTTMARIDEERARQKASEGKEKILIFDGLNTFIRNYAVVPEMDINGEPVGGLVGMLRSVKSMIRDVRPSRTVVVWDGPGGSRKRRGIMSEYKAGRKPKLNRQYDFESPEDGQRNFQQQYLRLRRFLENLGITQIEIADIEADDVIAFLCGHMETGVEKVVVTSDKDMFQLVDSKTLVYSPTKKLYYTSARITETFGVLPTNFIYMKVLDGDNSDNVKIAELKGLGPKTIVKLFPFLGERDSSLAEIVKHCEDNLECKNKSSASWYRKILDQKETLYRNAKLMQLSIPVISAQSIGKIRYAMTSPVPDFLASEFKMSLLKEGIQMKDIDLEVVFKEYHVRAKAAQERKQDAGE